MLQLDLFLHRIYNKMFKEITTTLLRLQDCFYSGYPALVKTKTQVLFLNFFKDQFHNERVAAVDPASYILGILVYSRKTMLNTTSDLIFIIEREKKKNIVTLAIFSKQNRQVYLVKLALWTWTKISITNSLSSLH